MKKFILLSAVPGSGKSTWANDYARKHQNVFIVSSDEIRKEVTGFYTDHTQENKVWPLFIKRIHDYGKIENVTVIADATNLTNHYRKMYFELTPEFDKHILVTFEKEWDAVRKQNLMRKEEKIVPDYAMDKLKAEWEEVTDDVKKLYDEYVLITKWFDVSNA
jgi:tRNA uridine 5-carbamoylmethylation protein Kti12